MIDDLRIAIFSAKASTIYFVISSIIIAVYMLGVYTATSSREDLCASDIIEAEKQRDNAQAINKKLTECETRDAVDCAINCEVICAEQVAQALASAEAWACAE